MNLPAELLVFLLAMAPISEVRGAIPTGLVFGMPFLKVFFISILGNLLSVFIVLLFLEPVSNFLSKKSKFFKQIIEKIFEKSIKKVDEKIKKYEEIGLVIFVAIPLPLTGGITGAIAAFLLGLPFWLSFFLISIGVLIASVIVSIFSISGIAIRNVFGWEAFFYGILLFLIIFLGYKVFKRKKP